MKMHFENAKTKKMVLPFKLVHNLIVLPGFINGSDTLNFILDTGVSHTMITSLNGFEGVKFNFSRNKASGFGRRK